MADVLTFGHSECVNGNGQIVLVSLTATPTGDPPAQYTECHAHGDEAWVTWWSNLTPGTDRSSRFCVDPSGDNVLVAPQGAAAQSESEEHNDDDGHDHADGDNHQDEQSQEEMDCHFHAGVE
jgi:solute carrier family 39 (zinc transporter), member 1/2/3